MYNEFSERYAALVAITHALKTALEDSPSIPVLECSTMDTETDTITTETQPVPIYTARDEAAYVEYNTPSLVIFQPVIIPMRDMVTNLKEYREYDYENMEVKEFFEPIPAKVRFKIHQATRNPDNDAKIHKWLTEQSFVLRSIDVRITFDSDEYDRMVVYWHDPEEMDSDDVSRITEYVVDVRTRLEILDFTRRKIFRPAADITYPEGDYTATKYYANAITAFNVYAGAVEVPMVTSLDKFPRAGTCEFEEDGDTFSYTGRTGDKFTGVTGIENFHRFGERINYLTE